MTGTGRFGLACGFGVLLALAGCGRGFMGGERPAWRHQAEEQCMRSGAVKLGAGVVEIKPIEGPGMCGADFPLRVAVLGEPGSQLSYSDVPRPPADIGDGSRMPQWPPTQPRYSQPAYNAAPVANVNGEQLRWTPGAPAITAPRTVAPQGYPQQSYAAPADQPMSLTPPGVGQPDDIPPDAILPQNDGARARPSQRAYKAPPQQRDVPPALGPARPPMNTPWATGAIQPAILKPTATLSCPIVSALDRWVSEGVQPAALHWFGVPVTTIHQIGAYSCREMVGSGTEHISEHAFGDALDISGFTFADGRKVTVKDGWKGTPEEQGFLHDVQLYACETFVTVLAPGYNIFHYNHIHVDLMRRASGRRPCRPTAIKGEIVAARARAVYASRHGGTAYTGSIPSKPARQAAPDAVPGADGEFDDDDKDTTSVSMSMRPAGGPRLISGSVDAIH
jgi:hypothetical protein